MLALIKTLGKAKKAFLTPLTRYRSKPCCDDNMHHVDYSFSGYLSALDEENK
jgi:hypothetical protein